MRAILPICGISCQSNRGEVQCRVASFPAISRCTNRPTHNDSKVERPLKQNKHSLAAVDFIRQCEKAAIKNPPRKELNLGTVIYSTHFQSSTIIAQTSRFTINLPKFQTNQSRSRNRSQINRHESEITLKALPPIIHELKRRYRFT
ncbi:unnamed protein product [Nezara viridula]|uniref:Uncharacterized protein n=1 Tax=Nezara viridula TaxID=85310 RepID=A0A9P0MR17_NEZVI|nr:unnamed protein product [Nezara viridula]